MANNNSQVVKCANCGADMIFDIAKGKLVCPYCDSENSVDVKPAVSRNYYNYKNDGEVRFEGVVCRCPNCDSEMEITDFSTSIVCPFCGATNIQKTDTLPGLKPDAILPFRITQEESSKLALKMVKKRLYAPYRLKKQFAVDKFNGVYVPAFVFDAGTTSNYDGRLGEYYYVTVGSGNNKRVERRIRYYNVSGVFNKNYDNLTIEASSHIDQKTIDKLMPFDYANGVAYDSRYIAGMQSERYSTSLEDSFGVAKQIMESDIKKGILAQYKADVVDYLNVSTNFNPVSFKYLLVPLWICSYSYRNRKYNLYVNARTGKTTGKTPKSVFKIILTILAILGIVGVLVYLYLTGKIFT